VTNGATGICYFADIIGLGFEAYDGTTPDLEAQLKKANAALMTQFSAPVHP
jgi:hypothetical protein